MKINISLVIGKEKNGVVALNTIIDESEFKKETVLKDVEKAVDRFVNDFMNKK